MELPDSLMVRSQASAIERYSVKGESSTSKSQSDGESSDAPRRFDCNVENEKPTCRDIFLSHSGFQKNFVEQLHRDLTRENMSSFFDIDPQSLPKGREFPSRIMENCRKCKVAVFVLSPEFLSSYWPMLELYTIVEAKNSSNPDVAILPLFFRISAKTLSDKLQLKDKELVPKWKELMEERKMKDCTDEWFKALKQIRKYNGLQYSEHESEMSYRDKIVECIRPLLPMNLPYKDSHVKGKERLCQEVDSLFKTAEGRNHTTAVGLYGIGGCGKTTISKILCNYYARQYNGKVFHVELGRGKCLETQKKLLRVLAGASERLLDSATSKEQGWPVLERIMSERKVFLALDNISDDQESIDEAISYLSLGFGKGSKLFLTTRSPHIFRSGQLAKTEIQIAEVPKLQEEEATAILLKHTSVEESKLTCEEKEIVRRSANFCCFGGKYHPLALEAFGASLFDEFGGDLTEWNEISDFGDATGLEGKEVFLVFERSLKAFSPSDVKIFMLVVLYLPDLRLSVDEALGWLSCMCYNKKVRDVRNVIERLKKAALIEDVDYIITVHDLVREFAQKQANENSKSWFVLTKAEEIPITTNPLEGVKLSHCAFPTLPISDNPQMFGQVLVIHLECISELTDLDLSSMKTLRSLVIEHCEGLKEIRGIERLPNLYWLQVVDNRLLTTFSQMGGPGAIRHLQSNTPSATRFVDLCKCVRLKHIHLKCQSLKEFPHFGGLPNLERAILRDCSELTEGLDFSGCSKLADIRFDGCPGMASPPKLENCSYLTNLHFKACNAMTHSPDLRGCSKLTYVDFIECPAMIRSPDLSRRPTLKTAVFRRCSSMTDGPDISGCTLLDNIRFEGCSKMRRPPLLNGCSNLRFIQLTGSKELDEFPNLDGLTALQNLWVDESVRIEKAPEHFEVCIGQTSLIVRGPENLRELSRDIPGYVGFIRLGLTKCGGLLGYFGFAGLSFLKRFTLWECQGVVEPPDLAGCGSLENFEIKGCNRLRRFPSFAGLSNLKWLVLRECEVVADPPDLRGCTALVGIDLRDNPNMEGVPCMLHCNSLLRLQITWRHDTTQQKRIPPQITRCPIFRFRSSRENFRTRVYSLGDQRYQYVEVSVDLLLR